MDKPKIILLGEKNAPYCLIQAVDAHEEALLEQEYLHIRACTETPFALAAFRVEDWNRDLSPWAADAVFGKNSFAGGAAQTLTVLTHTVLPDVRQTFWTQHENMRYILGGYSLSALFALWACSRTDVFSGCAAASPSVWFPGWLDDARAHSTHAACVYLSLGDKEANAKNPVMARVADCIRQQNRLFEGKADHVLEWNPGNHFRDPEVRTAKAFAWCINRIQAQTPAQKGASAF